MHCYYAHQSTSHQSRGEWCPFDFYVFPDYMYNVFALRAFLSCRNPTFILELREGKSVPVDMAAGLWCGLVRPE